MSLIEVLVASAVSVIVMLGMASMMSHQNVQIAGLRTISTRDNLKSLADRYLASSSAVTTSLDSSQFSQAASLGNQTLNRCLNGNGAATACPTGSDGIFPNCCIAKDAANSPLYTPFSLADPADPSPTGKKLFSGTDTSPARYDVEGAPCVTASKRCVFELISQYLPVCASAATACPQATSVSIRYSLGPAPDFTSPGGIALRTLASTPVLLGSAAAGPSPGAGLLAIRYLTTGTYTPTPGTTSAEVTVWGAGGGGGMGQSCTPFMGCSNGGNGGGGGSVTTRIVIAGPVSVTVGAGGSAVSFSGGAGGSSIFGPVTAFGGGGGSYMGANGTSGGGSGGTIIVTGGGAAGGVGGAGSESGMGGLGTPGAPGSVLIREYGQ